MTVETNQISFLLLPVGKSLLWVAILLVLIVYIFAVISFAVLRSEFQDEDNENVFCRTLDECFISVLRFGLIDSFLVCITRVLGVATKRGKI